MKRKPPLTLKKEYLYQSNIFNKREIIYKDIDGSMVSQRVILPNVADKAMVYNVWVHVLERLRPHIKDAYNNPDFDYDSLRDVDVEIPVKDFKFSKDYKRVKKACQILFGMCFRFDYEDDEVIHQEGYNAFSYFKSEFFKKKGLYHVKMIFSSLALKFLVDFTKGYTAIDRAEILKLKTFYSKRIYEWLCQFKKTGFFKISERDFREVLGLTGKYKTFYDLKKFVIDPSVVCIKTTTVFKDLVCEILGDKEDGRTFLYRFSPVAPINSSKEKLDYKNQFSRILLTYVFWKYVEHEKLKIPVLSAAIDYIRSQTPLKCPKRRKDFVSRIRYLEDEAEAGKGVWRKNDLYALTNYIIAEDFELNISEVKNKFFNENKQLQLF